MQVPGAGAALLVGALGCALLGLSRSLRHAALLAWIGLGAGLGALDAPPPPGEHPLDPWLTGQPLLIEGRVTAPAVRYPEGEWAVVLDLSRPVAGRVRLRGAGDDPPGRGDRVAARARLAPHRAFATPGQPDRWRAGGTRRTRASAYPTPRAAMLIVRGSPGPIVRARDAVRAFLTARLEDPVEGLALALVLGDRSRLDEEMREGFRRTGTSHLLAISGLHVGVVAYVVGWIGRWLVALLPFLRVRIAPRTAGVFLGLTAAAGYGAMTGWAISTCRATAMAAVLALLLVGRRRIDAIQVCAAAACILLLAEPAALWEPATALSFGSVVAIVRLTPPPAGHRIRALVAGSAAAAVGTAPWTLGLFGEVSLVSVPANLAAIPVLGMVLVPLLLASVGIGAAWATGGTALLAMAETVARAGGAVIGAMGDPRWSPQLTASPPPALTALSVGVLAIGLCLPRRWQRWAGALLAAALAASPWHPGAPPGGELTLTVLDVGHGDAILISTPAGEHWLMDAGGRPRGLDPGAAVVVPALRRLGVDRLDAALVSHLHVDHYGGMEAVLESLPVEELWLPMPPPDDHPARSLVEVAHSQGVPIGLQVAHRFSGVRGGCRIEQLHPRPGRPCPGGARDCGANGHSSVLRLTHGRVAFLLTGDMEADLEEELVRSGAPLRAHVLKVPHHGSATSSTPLLLAAVDPWLAVASVDPDSRHRLPRPSVTHRYRGGGALWRATGTHGTVQVSTDGHRVRVRTFDLRRGWSRWRPVPGA